MKKTKFLILRFSSIGDIVLTTPVIRCLKLQFPDAEIHFATKKQFNILLENNPYIDKIHLLEKSDNQLISDLKKENFDNIIDLHNNLRTLKIKFLLNKKSFSFNKLNFKKWLLVNFKINRLPNIHIVDRYLKTVKSFGIKNDLKGLDFFIPQNDKINLESWKDFRFKPKFRTQNPELRIYEYVAFAIGGQHFTKKLPNHKIVELCKKIEKPIILLGGKEDFENGELIKKEIGEKIINACGEFNINQSASIIEQSEYIITHDTGLMHIASALKKRVISIWGNTVPEFGMYPYLTDYQVIENKNLDCRPCSKIGFNKCPKGHFKCMNDLDFSDFGFLEK